MRLNLPPMNPGETPARGADSAAGMSSEALALQLCSFRQDTSSMAAEMRDLKTTMQDLLGKVVALLEQSNECVKHNGAKLDSVAEKSDALMARGDELGRKADELKARGDKVIERAERSTSSSSR